MTPSDYKIGYFLGRTIGMRGVIGLVVLFVGYLVYEIAASSSPTVEPAPTRESQESDPAPPKDDHEIHILASPFGSNPVSDARTYSVPLIGKYSHEGRLPPRTELFAQGKIDAFGGGRVFIKDDRSNEGGLICSLSQDEFDDVRYLYKVGDLVQVYGEYFGTDRNSVVFRNCRLSSPTDKVVRLQEKR